MVLQISSHCYLKKPTLPNRKSGSKQSSLRSSLKRHLEAFRSQKNVSPFDIQINSKSRIPINLSFFLVDQAIQDVKTKEAPSQTEKFVPFPTAETAHNATGRHRNEKQESNDRKFVPKKTGRDQGSQVDVTKLINFEQEVRPIVTVIVTKTIEQALWEVENERELEQMQKVKEQHYEANTAQILQKQEEFIEREVEQINAKYSFISKAVELDNENFKKEQPKEAGEGAIVFELPERTIAEECLAEFAMRKQAKMTEDLEFAKDWLISKAEEFALENEKKEAEVEAVFRKMIVGTLQKVNQMLTKA